MNSLTLLISLISALVIAGIGYVVMGRKIDSHDRASRRVANVSRAGGPRVNLRKANGSYVMYTKTDADGKASFEVVPEAARSTFQICASLPAGRSR